MDTIIEDWSASLESDLSLMQSVFDDDFTTDLRTDLPAPVDFTRSPQPFRLFFYTDGDHEITHKMFASVGAKFLPVRHECVQHMNDGKITPHQKHFLLSAFQEFYMFFMCYQQWFQNMLSKIECRYAFQFIHF